MKLFNLKNKKKAYTLIELSVVLLVLSLLSGILLMSRSIIDRAKIQRVILELDYYEKAFHQFYDTYRTVPGSYGYRRCSRNVVFSNYKNNKYNNFCNCIAINNEQDYSDQIIFGWLSYSPYAVASQLAVSGLIETEPTILQQNQAEGDFCPYSSTNIGNGYLVGHWQQNTGTALRTSFDKNGYVQITGYFFDRMIAGGETLQHYEKYAYATSNKYFNSNLPHEFDDEDFKKYLNKHNAITMYHYEDGFAIDYSALFSDRRANSRNHVGFLNSKNASHLDIKFDDGFPGSGRILAMKSGIAHYQNVTAREHMASCYNKRANKVSDAMYYNSTDIRYGCNITYVMKDVR